MDQATYERLAAAIQERYGERISHLLTETDEWAKTLASSDPGAPFLVRVAVAVHALAPYVAHLGQELETALGDPEDPPVLDEAWHGFLVGTGRTLVAVLEGAAATTAEMIGTVPNLQDGENASDGAEQASAEEASPHQAGPKRGLIEQPVAGPVASSRSSRRLRRKRRG
ncbi:MAG: hypothetical protein CL878_04120 [Dehalococcoidia bacterium]|nr:hypothetical protein [Dehalococcoidia bacterium]